MSVIDRSIAFVSTWEPDFGAGLRGTSTTTIAELERHMGRPCSAVYRAFLERMGKHAGSVDFGQYTTDVEMLLVERETALQHLPPGVELFAMSTGDAETDVFLVHDPMSPDDPRIVRHPSLEYEETGEFDLARADVVAGGFGELLCLPALNRHHVPVQPYRVALLARELRPDALARCRAIADAFGLEPYWFSNDACHVAHEDELVVIAKQAPGSFLSVGVAGPDGFAVATVAGTMRFRLGLADFR